MPLMNNELSYPRRHLSIRVPWHDSQWNGGICINPRRNLACLKLRNIAEKKEPDAEQSRAGQLFKDLHQNEYPACVTERGGFMSSFAYERLHRHPYQERGVATHAHFVPTPLRYLPYSAMAVPFRWLRKDMIFGGSNSDIRAFANDFPLEGVSLEFEPDLGFDSGWFQDHRNHRVLLDCFWNHIKPEESLVFFYAKQIPLVEDTGRRVIVGVGRVKKIGPLTEYLYQGQSERSLRSLIWERAVHHSIRSDFSDGFLLPYHEALEQSQDGAAFDPAEVVAFAPEDRFTEFSYVTEHVSTDAAIEALLSCREALHRATELFDVNVYRQEEWIDRELGRLWRKRGAFPGMGAVLSAMGVPLGNFIAQAIANKAGDTGSPWLAWFDTLTDPESNLPRQLARNLDGTIVKTWQRLPVERRAFLELLSRIDLSLDQAESLVEPQVRKKQDIDLPDGAFLENPYLIYETSRLSVNPISIYAVDRGVFPSAYVREHFPIEGFSEVQSAVDARRIRAITIKELEKGVIEGHTLQSRDHIIQSIRHRDEEEDRSRTLVTADLMTVVEDELFAGEIRTGAMADNQPFYQLERLGAAGDLIRRTVEKRLKAARHTINADWRAEFDRILDVPLPNEPEEREVEEKARDEKAAALDELASARFSVLIGPAGTGKTTLLSVLCQRPEVHTGGILLLAPTGKARVKMESFARNVDVPNYRALTLAQFLLPSGRYDGNTGRYLLTNQPAEFQARTVIVDECSMLTEEMMAALLEALTGVHRLIFVGDPRQLPPIGAGRPFVDIIARLRPDDIDSLFPRVSESYAELTIPRRQGAGERHDLQLASWFGGSPGPGDDEVFEILAGARQSETLLSLQWETPDELEAILPQALGNVLGFPKGEEEWRSFALSLGGQVFNGNVYFNSKYLGKGADSWQILSPVRQKAWGVESLNALIHRRYKDTVLQQARTSNPWQRRFFRPMGPEQIVYGDKVINNRNMTFYGWRIWPKPPGGKGFLANGEIGIVVGEIRTRKRPREPKLAEIEFSTQSDYVYKFQATDFDDDSEASLELAYALTVHKAQGSDFDVVFVVLPRSPLMLTRELIYTALTRQKQKVVILHQGSITDIQKLSAEHYSATATRLSNLFTPPHPVQVGEAFLEEGLIHVTIRGEPVRSKSEVIIANLLHGKGINYQYERPLQFDKVPKYPDFTIEDDDTGITYYWEHLGMLGNYKYRKRWEAKQEWYRQNGILPYTEGGGPVGTLIVTRDNADGGIDSAELHSLVAEVFDV